MTTGQIQLNNIYQSIAFQNPRMAELMYDDISVVAMYGLSAEKSGGQAAADRLRRQAFDLPEVHRRVLNHALTELGYL